MDGRIDDENAMRETKRPKSGGARTRRRKGKRRQKLPLQMSVGGPKKKFEG